MFTGLSIQVLGKIRAGVFTPCPVQPCSYFQGERVVIGSKAWSYPALVLRDSTVSPRHALILKDGEHWVIQDMDSDNGIRSVRLTSESDLCPEPAQQAFRFEFTDELCCCIGAVVVRLKAAEQLPRTA